MYCPKCGQQAPSNDVRFCNRCGLGLYEISLWLDGAEKSGLPFTGALVPKKRNRRTRNGVKLIFLSLVILPVAFLLSIVAENPGPLVVPLTIFLAGFFWMQYSRLFDDELTQEETAAKMLSVSENRMISQGVESTAQVNWMTGRSRTAEIVQPPSVTDRTTILLDKETGS